MKTKKQNKRYVFKFKHFSRKGYAAFAVLGREFVIGTLSVVMLQHSDRANASISAIENPTDTLSAIAQDADLDEIEVSGTRAPLSAGQSARIVSVLHVRDIQGAAAQSVNDLLKLCAGVDVRQRAALGAQTDISVRGGTSEHTAILLNDIPITDPQTGHNVLDLPIQLSEIERIEILEGPAGRVYGAQSMTGAINIITKPKSQTSFDFQTESGSFGYLNVGARANLASGETIHSKSGDYNGENQKPLFNNQISGSYTRSDGFNRAKSGRLNNDYEGAKLFNQGNYDFLSWSGGMTRKGWGSSTSYSVKSDEQYEFTEKYYANITATNKAKSKGRQLSIFNSKLSIPTISATLYFQQNNDRFEFFRGQPDEAAFNHHKTNIFGGSLNAWLAWKLGRTSAGMEIRNEDWRCNTLGSLNRTNYSLHLEHNISLKRFTLSAGFMGIKNTQTAAPMKLYPGLDASLQITRHWKLYSSLNTSMRLPTFTDLFYSVNNHKADPHLKPEKMTAVEIGAKYFPQTSQGGAQNNSFVPFVTVSLFHHRGTDMIDWIIDTRDGENADWRSVNHAKVNSYGAEINGKIRMFTFGYTFIYQEQDTEPHIQSLYTLEYLRHKLVGTASIIPFKNVKAENLRNISINISYRFQDRLGKYTTTAGETNTYSPYSIVDLKAEWRKKRTSVYIEANNLFSTHYIDFGNVPQPGIWFVAGVKMDITSQSSSH